MLRSYRLLGCLAIMALLPFEKAFALKVTRYATVEIVDAPTSILPITSPISESIIPVFSSRSESSSASNNSDNEGNKSANQGNSGAKFLVKEIKKPKTTDGFSQETITAEYAISGTSNNNVQLALQENKSQKSDIKLESMQASYKKTGIEASIKLATTVKFPNNIKSGNHKLSMQLSALYE